MLPIEKYSFGMGDRFARQGSAQLAAVVRAQKRGVNVTPVWNKSNREHGIVKSGPASVRAEADAAVKELGWSGAYHVDADHVNLATVDRFVAPSDFFTIDVVDYIGRPADDADVAQFTERLVGRFSSISIPGLKRPLVLTKKAIEEAARKFLGAIQEAGRIYRHILKAKGDHFITEVSVDETDTPQTPLELFLILAMLSAEKVPVQTVAPKFTGRFNKGVDYVGDLARFEAEFEADLCVIRFAIREFELPEMLKLSVHSGSDKFSLYPIIRRLTKEHQAGLHVKTAGTTWLAEVIGLAQAGGDGLAIAREIYAKAFSRLDELIKPYGAVIDIDPGKLPSIGEVSAWSSEAYAQALTHDVDCPAYNPDFRQFLHVSFKIAAEMGDRYLQALTANRSVVAQAVTDNLDRHLQMIFG